MFLSSVMSGRKRSNPQRIDVENDAKRRELCFYQFLPRERPSTLPESQSHGFQLPTHDTSHALQPLSDLENSSGTPQIIGNNFCNHTTFNMTHSLAVLFKYRYNRAQTSPAKKKEKKKTKGTEGFSCQCE